MKCITTRTLIVRSVAAICAATFTYNAATAAILFTDGFGDGDRDNNGLDAGAVVTNAADVGVPWLLTDGTSAVNFLVVDDSAGIGNGNALRMFNTGSNNRPSVGRFTPVTLNDGDKLILRFDARMLTVTNAAGAPLTADRAFRFGLYQDVLGNNAATDQGSGGILPQEDLGYNARVDAGADASNATSMDVTRDDSATNIIQGTTTGIGVASTNAADQMADALKRHFELTLQRSGTGMLVTLQQDANPAISAVDATPTGFTFNEVAIGLRSNAAMDMRFDNIQVEHIAIPEPASLGLLLIGACGLGIRRRR